MEIEYFESPIEMVKERIRKLNETKAKIGDTGTRDYFRSIEWIDSLISINERMLKFLGGK